MSMPIYKKSETIEYKSKYLNKNDKGKRNTEKIPKPQVGSLLGWWGDEDFSREIRKLNEFRIKKAEYREK